MSRLIDADELKKDDEVIMWLSNDAIRTGKQLKMFSELFIKKIDDAPTVKAIPIPDNATNGDIIMALFGDNYSAKKSWWNALYKGSDTE